MKGDDGTVAVRATWRPVQHQQPKRRAKRSERTVDPDSPFAGLQRLVFAK